MADNDAKVMSWKVYGREGHMQRESCNRTKVYDFTEGDNCRHIAIINADVLRTHEYSIIEIARNTYEECEEELQAQLSDGIFENSCVGRIELFAKSI